MASVSRSGTESWPEGPAASASAGSITSTSTVNRSSTISQPTADRPAKLFSRSRSISDRSSTTVLATEIARPSTMPSATLQPQIETRTAVRAVVSTIWATAPGIASTLTASRSRIEKWMPTPNISRITPSSASCGARCVSATKPGVNGPTATPASR